jgi:Crp-like helix-turn-helix domain
LKAYLRLAIFGKTCSTKRGLLTLPTSKWVEQSASCCPSAFRDDNQSPEGRSLRILLAEMLAAQRPTGTNAARELEGAGLIARGRREVTILDRHGLIAASCECCRWSGRTSLLTCPKQKHKTRIRPGLVTYITDALPRRGHTRGTATGRSEAMMGGRAHIFVDDNGWCSPCGCHDPEEHRYYRVSTASDVFHEEAPTRDIPMTGLGASAKNSICGNEGQFGYAQKSRKWPRYQAFSRRYS